MANQARLQIVIDALNEASGELKAIQGDLNGVGEASESSSKKQSSALKSLTDNYMNVRSAVSDAVSGLKEIWDFAAQGAENDRIADSFKTTADSVNVNADRMMEALDKAAAGTVDDEVLMQAATRAMALGVATSTQDMTAMMELARVSSKRFGGDAGQAFTSITDAIGNLQPRALKQMGIIIDLKAVNDEYAKSLGTTADQLTEEEQRTALRNAVLEKSKSLITDVGNAGLDTADKMKRLEVRLGNMVDSLKEFAATGMDTFALIAGEGTNTLVEAFTASQEKIKADLVSGQMTLQDYNAAVAGMAQGVMAWDRATGVALLDQSLMTQEMLTQAQALYAATQGVYGQAGALDESTRATQRTADATRAAADAEAAKAQSIANAKAEMADYEQQLAMEAIAQENTRKSSEAAAAAAATYAAKTAEVGAAAATTAQQLASVTDAQAKQMLAQAQLDTLKTARENQTISEKDYSAAINATLLQYDLATPKSIAMADAQQKVNDAFLSGDMPLKAFIDSSGKIPKIAADGKVTLEELTELGIKPTTAAARDQSGAVRDVKAAWDVVPRNVKTTYTIETHGSVPAGGSTTTGGGGGNTRAMGGPVNEGWWYLHDDEYVLSRAMREGRQAIPGEAVPSRGVMGTGSTIYHNETINLHDTLVTKMYLDDQRARGLAELEATM